MIPATSKATTGNQTGQRVGMSINDIDNKAPEGYNPFDLSYSFYCTPKAGEVTPFFVQNSVGKTLEVLYHNHQVRAYTFNAPLMSQMRMHKAYYSVPMSCIMRHTWPYFFANPNKGDDVPDDVVCKLDVGNLVSVLSLMFDEIKSTAAVNSSSHAINLLRGLLLPSLFFSYSSLFNHTKEPINRMVKYSSSDNSLRLASVDKFVSYVVDYLLSADDASGLTIVNNSTPELVGVRKVYGGSLSSARDVIFTLMTDASWEADDDSSGAWIAFLTGLLEKMNTDGISMSTSQPEVSEINIDRLIAYQLACAQFFTTSTVDYVYDSRLWQSNTEGIFLSIFPALKGLPMFDYNGFKIQYDPYSYYWNSEVVAAMETIDYEGDIFTPIYAYWSNLLAFNRSLRYVDYFTGGRVQPLAVGDVNAPVTGSNVSAVDITIAIQKQRMLAASNRTGPELREYLKGIFGYEPISMPAEPHFISSQTFTVQSGQVANTAELPPDTGTSFGRIVENVNFSDSNKAFLAYIDEESIIVGVCYFDYIPAYIHAVDKHAFHFDRFDRFQPYLQTIGEQKVEERELDFSRTKSTDPYAYQIRNMEYKQRFSSAAGGFVEYLPGWALLDDISDTYLSSDTIRQDNVRFDELYSSLTGTNMASYFHFIMSNVFDATANQPMLRKPQIL